MSLKRFGLVLLVFGVGLIFFIWNAANRNAPQTQPAPQAESQPTTQSASRPAPAPASIPASVGAPQAQAAQPSPDTKPATQDTDARPKWVTLPRFSAAGPILLGSLRPEEPYRLQVELTEFGAGVKEAKLRDFFETVQDKQLFDKNPSEYEKARLKDPKKYKGHLVLLQPVGAGHKAGYAYATRLLRIGGLPGEAGQLTFDLAGSSNPEVGSRWNLLPGATNETASLIWQLDRDLNCDKPNLPAKYVPYVQLVKTYKVSKDDYSISVSLAVRNLLVKEELEKLRTEDQSARLLSDEEIRSLLKQSSSLSIALDQSGPSGLEKDDLSTDYRRTAVGHFNTERGRVEVALKSAEERFKEKKPEVPVGKSDDKDPALWVGCTNKYFASLMYLFPQSGDAGQLQAPTYAATFYFYQPQDSSGVLGGVSFPHTQVAPGTELAIRFDAFTGPKGRTLFTSPGPLPARELYARLNYLAAIEISGCFCSVDWLTWGMMWLLEKLSWLTLGNYGVAIIVLVLLVRLALYPLTKKSQVSMVKMQKLGPQINKLKEKYKDDKQALNKEIMGVYKQAGATPILGCLPMFLQMPIWIALWTSLNMSVDLRHAPLIPVWITDLSAPDALFSWAQPLTTTLPLLGKLSLQSFNLLPLLLTVAMFFQMKMTPQTAQAAADPAQAKQQKMMSYMMPAMMLLFFYQAPSGLNLYIMTSTFAGLIEQKVIRDHIRKREEAQAAIETTVALPGKGPRGSRPKKPRGPLWFRKG